MEELVRRALLMDLISWKPITRKLIKTKKSQVLSGVFLVQPGAVLQHRQGEELQGPLNHLRFGSFQDSGYWPSNSRSPEPLRVWRSLLYRQLRHDGGFVHDGLGNLLCLNMKKFRVGVLCWNPSFQVVGFSGCRESHIRQYIKWWHGMAKLSY